MKKFIKERIRISIAGLGTALLLAPLIWAFETHILNVSAAITNTIFVPITGLSLSDMPFGVVFPQEKLEKQFDIELSQTFINQFDEVPAFQWATSTVLFSQGLRKNGTPVLPLHSNPTSTLDAAQTAFLSFDTPAPPAGSYFSLGFGGSITLKFEKFIPNFFGPDIRIYETTSESSSYPIERVKVEASKDGITWTLLTASAPRDANVDLGPLPWAKYVRLTDVSNPALFPDATANGYDVDAVRAYSRDFLTGAVSYAIRQKPSCVDAGGAHTIAEEDVNGAFSCPSGFTMMPTLCPYLSKHELTADNGGENDSPGINAFHGLPGEWDADTVAATEVSGLLSILGLDWNDRWNIDLRVPCFRGMCAQDWDDFVKTESGNPDIDADAYAADPTLQGANFGCDLWLEVTNIE